MPLFNFTAGVHARKGSKGWAPDWYPSADPLPGEFCAHDILEHFPNDKGDIAGELLAIGAKLYIRGDGGYISDFAADESYTIAELIGKDIADGNPWPTKAPKNKPSALDARAELTIRRTVREAFRKAREEHGPAAYHLTGEDSFAVTVALLRQGYRLARKRYWRHDAQSLTRVFREIEHAANDRLAWAIPGDSKLAVTFEPETLAAHIH